MRNSDSFTYFRCGNAEIQFTNWYPVFGVNNITARSNALIFRRCKVLRRIIIRTAKFSLPKMLHTMHGLADVHKMSDNVSVLVRSSFNTLSYAMQHDENKVTKAKQATIHNIFQCLFHLRRIIQMNVGAIKLCTKKM